MGSPKHTKVRQSGLLKLAAGGLVMLTVPDQELPQHRRRGPRLRITLLMDVRTLLASTALALTLLQTAAPVAAAPYPMPDPGLNGVDINGFRIPRITSFGDSYSRLGRSVRHPTTQRWVPVPNWAEQSVTDGHAGAVAGYAVSGATAANIAVYNGQVNSFAQQVNRWITNGRQLGPTEATVVYLGANDVNAIDAFPTLESLQRSKNDYGAAMKRLISSGATSGDRRAFLFLMHDWGRNPAQNGDPGLVFRKRSQNWNNYVKYFAKGRANVVTVDLYTTFNNVFANPSAYGLGNVRTVDLDRSATTALFADPNHFGQKGQDIIEQVFLHYAARAWGWGTAASASSQVAARIGQDVNQGITAGLDSLPPEQRLGLNAFTVGEVEAGFEADDDAVDADPTRAGFAQAYHPDERPDGGLGVNYALSDGLALGVVFGRYTERVTSELERNSDAIGVSSDAVSLYLDQKAHGFAFRTRLTVADHEHSRSEHDGLIGVTSQGSFDGRTTELAQRAGRPLELHGVVVTPWLELAHRRQETDAYTVDNPYLSDVTYSATEAGETLGGIGLDARLEPLALGEAARLSLFGGVAYTHSLQRDAYELTISEAAGLGADQQETIERAQLRQLSLNVGARLDLGDRLAVNAGLGMVQDLDYGDEQEVSVRLSYRF